MEKCFDESYSRPSSQLDLTGAAVSIPDLDSPKGDTEKEGAPPIVLPYQEPEYVQHIAIDAGGSLIKLVYMSKERSSARSEDDDSSQEDGTSSYSPGTGGRLHFVKFQTSNVEDCVKFICSKGLHRTMHDGCAMRVKATGGGSFRFAEIFKEKIGLILEREDEIECIVEGTNFLLKTLRYEAFTFSDGKQEFVAQAQSDDELYPYLLVNIGSGVSIVKVEGDGKFERVSGTNLGGGTFWGLCRLLTRCTGFDEMLELAMRGDNSKVDMLVGDIYGGSDYAKAGLSASTIASSFGKVVMEGKDLEEYNPADIALALCRMVSYNIGQLAFLNAQRYGMKRVYFGGFFIRGLPYTMETISFAIRFWSKGELKALFLRHEGFLGAMGAFLKINPIPTEELQRGRSQTIKAKFTEHFRMGAPFVGGKVQGEAIKDVSGKVSWVEKFVQAGIAAASGGPRIGSSSAGSEAISAASSREASESEALQRSPRLQLDLHVGVLHYSPTLEPFPLVADLESYDPNTIDITSEEQEREFWLRVLEDQVPTYVQKAVSSDGCTAAAQRRADAFGTALKGHLNKLREEPSAYGKLGLAELFELREECLREFSFDDAYKLDKGRENSVAMEVLPDLMAELDNMGEEQRLLSLVEGVLAANIFDWGAKQCVELYNNGTILDIYRKARGDICMRPWRVDTFDRFRDRWFQRPLVSGRRSPSAFQRAILFVDNAGADVVLGMIPFARELLKGGSEVVMVANSQPAINDITVHELRALIKQTAELCPVIAAARRAGRDAIAANGGKLPPPSGVLASSHRTSFELRRAEEMAEALERTSLIEGPRLYVLGSGHGSPCLDLRRVTAELADASVGADLVVIEGMGRAIHTNLYCQFRCPSLKLAMVKNAHVAERLFNGGMYDCICLYEDGAC
mmetsp:Transcript_3468/g.8203  ORF Transcript_3468/g.8203 Transcript_3468/m.8203 type:complete len:911 (+) Transcript_3468:246-2978(+)